MALNWTPALAVGIDEIDKQHQELFQRINQLYKAIIGGDSQVAVETIEFLRDYAQYHFKTEESHMASHHYRELDAHRQLHAELIVAIDELAEESIKNGPSVELSVKVQRSVRDWLVQHISHEDQRYGLYLEENRHKLKAQ